MVQLCQHRMDNTRHCQCPALSGKRYCPPHQRQHQRGAKKMAERMRQRWFEAVPLNDPRAVQRALAQVIQGLLSGEIEPRQAGQILYKLQTAVASLNASLDPGKL